MGLPNNVLYDENVSAFRGLFIRIPLSDYNAIQPRLTQEEYPVELGPQPCCR